MKITERNLKNIIRNIVLESMKPGGEEMKKLSRMLRQQFPENVGKGHRFMVHSDGILLEPEHLGWLVSQEYYRNTSFKVKIDSTGRVRVLFDL